MKKKLFMFLLFLLFTSKYSYLQAQTMYVRYLSGAQSAYTITNIKKLTFSGDNLLITPVSGSLVAHSKTGNRYINFNDLTLATTTYQLASPSFYVYPNPVDDVLNISITNGAYLIDDIEIITLDGRMMLRQNQINNSIPRVIVSSLPQGIYLCKITSENRTQTLKFIKQ